MKRFLISAGLLLALSVGAIAQPASTPDDLRRIIAALERQRNMALSMHAQTEAKMTEFAEGLEKARARIAELEHENANLKEKPPGN